MKIVLVKSTIVSVIVILFCILAFAGNAEETLKTQQLKYDKSAASDGIKHYENNEDDKAIPELKKALAGTFTSSALSKIETADEKQLRTLFDSPSDAAVARYTLAMKYEKDGKTKEAATLFRNALSVVTNNGAQYVGGSKCKKCHLKQYMSWKKTEMAKTYDVLKPGQAEDAKESANLSIDKDYTKDASCLSCHTTGFDMPGGYATGKGSSRAGKDFAAITCEGCHGPGSKYIVLHTEIAKNKRSYNSKEHYDAGGYEIKAAVCTTCHNRRNPTTDADFEFDYEEYKDEDIHKSFPLKYRSK